jgi:SRSO17 transposase
VSTRSVNTSVNGACESPDRVASLFTGIWSADKKRRKAAGILEEIEFRTKPAVDRRIPSAPVLADAAYGNDTKFREGISELGLLYVVGVQSSTTVWKPGQVPMPKRKWKGIGRPTSLLRRDRRHKPIPVRELALSLPASAWKTVVWREGTRKSLRSRFAAMQIRTAHRDYWSSEPRPEEWLLIEWPSLPQPCGCPSRSSCISHEYRC